MQNYRTERNSKPGAVFEDLVFTPSDGDGVEGNDAFDLQQPIPDNEIIDVIFEDEACPY